MEKLGKHDVALALVCSAIDGTAKKLYPEQRKNNVRYKKFLKDYMRIITTFGFPILIRFLQPQLFSYFEMFTII